MNQAVERRESDWRGKTGHADIRRAEKPDGAAHLADLVTSGGRSLHRLSTLLWILALLCFVLAAFVWWELLHV